jgi:hypothetical protein
MTLKQLRARIAAKKAAKEPHNLAGIRNGGELYINDQTGKTVFGPMHMERDFAKKFCEELGIPFTED